jgi:hypothetical protein
MGRIDSEASGRKTARTCQVSAHDMRSLVAGREPGGALVEWHCHFERIGKRDSLSATLLQVRTA